MPYTFYDNTETGERACYLGTLLCWRIPFDEIEMDEEPFGTYAPSESEIIHEDADEPPFIETLGYRLYEPVEVRQVGADFTDWPANPDDPEVSMRLTEWANGEGFDVTFDDGIHTDIAMFSMTWTRYEMLNKLAKLLEQK